MSRNGQARGAVLLGRFELPAGTWFPWHEHPTHQLAWSARGTIVVRVGEASWVLPPSRALWLPAGTRHRTGMSGRADLRGVYVDPARCPVEFGEARMLGVGALLRELLLHLHGELAEDARLRAEAVLFDLIEPVLVTPLEVPMPSDPRARTVAEAVLADPADGRGLAELARTVGASARTVSRLFLTECLLTFGQWRTHARLRAALGLLAAGLSQEAVARRVGYSSASAFVAAFRRTLGVPPGAYLTG